MGSELLDEFENVLSAGIDYYLLAQKMLPSNELFQQWMKIKSDFKAKLLELEDKSFRYDSVSK